MKTIDMTDEQILLEADRSLRSNKWQLNGIIILIVMGLAKGWTVYLESEIDNATTAAIILQHRAEECYRLRASVREAFECSLAIEVSEAALREIASMRSDLPNVALLEIFGKKASGDK